VFSGAFGRTWSRASVGKDTIQLTTASSPTSPTVQSQAAQVGADVVITLDASNAITLQNVDPGQPARQRLRASSDLKAVGAYSMRRPAALRRAFGHAISGA
jgi:hypothetical protein